MGRAGVILEQILKHTVFQFQYLITNSICCRPVDVIFLDYDLEKNPPSSLEHLEEGEDYQLDNWNRDPTKAESELCASHIDELIESYIPHGVIYLGQIATRYKTKLPHTTIKHPAAIARQEYKLHTVLQQARLIDGLMHKLHQKEGIA